MEREGSKRIQLQKRDYIKKEAKAKENCKSIKKNMGNWNTVVFVIMLILKIKLFLEIKFKKI